MKLGQAKINVESRGGIALDPAIRYKARRIEQACASNEIFMPLTRRLETSKDQFGHMGRIILDCCKALGGIHPKDIDKALEKMSKSVA